MSCQRNFISNYLLMEEDGIELRFVALCKTKSTYFESETMSKLSNAFVRQRPESPAHSVLKSEIGKCNLE